MFQSSAETVEVIEKKGEGFHEMIQKEKKKIMRMIGIDLGRMRGVGRRP